MKLFCLTAVICICFLLAGCKNQSPQTDLSGTQQHTETSTESHTQGTNETPSDEFLKAEQGSTVALNAFGLEQVVISKKMFADSPSSKVFTTVYILEDTYSPPHKTYLLLNSGNKFLFCDLEATSLENNLFLCDVDGNGIQEIIIQQCLDHSGGAGNYLSRIFRIEAEKIVEIFTASNNFDTGFTSDFLENKKLLITNNTVNFQIVLDISDRYNEDFFDNSGKCARDIHIWCDSFYEFIPKDIDNDSIYEIVCKQYVSLDGHADGIGYTRSVLKFNAETEQFVIIEAEFSAEQ